MTQEGHVFLPGYDLPMAQGSNDILLHRTVARKSRRTRFAIAPSRSQYLAAVCFASSDLLLSFTTRKPRSWLRQRYFGAYRKIARKLLMRHLIVVLGFKFHVYRCSLARARGPSSPMQAPASLQMPSRPGNSSPRGHGRGRHNQLLDPLHIFIKIQHR